MLLFTTGKYQHNNTLVAKRLKLTAAVAASLFPSTLAGMGIVPEPQTKLVVGIMVNDLRSEYISLLKDHFTEGGFKRLINNGVVIANLDFGTAVDPAAATAIIFTGASPAYNGVPAANIFDRSTLTPVPTLSDPQAMGANTTQRLSPANLSMTTITDEMRVAGGGINFAYAIANNPEQAIIMAGHAGNSGMWINSANEKWASTNFYSDIPSTLGSRNRLRPLHSRIDTMTWSPALSSDHYMLLPEHLRKFPFKYVYRSSGPQKMRQFKASPRSNDEVTDFAIENLTSLRLGNHSGTDMLNVAYNLQPYDYSYNSDNRYEILDQYYRLDKNLATLFDAINKNVGLENAIIFLSGTPASPESRRDEERWKLPYGEFSSRKAISLINLYLIALYGNGEWVQGYYNNQFFLNHQLIDQRKLDIETVRKEVARFLERMAGIAKAYSLDEIIDNRGEDMAALRRNTNIAKSGDVLANVLPGWQIVDDFNVPGPASYTNKVVRAAAATSPAYILAPGFAPKTISEAVDARAIAPTITSLLRIRSPNGASVAPLSLD